MRALFVSMPGDPHLIHAVSTPSLVLDTGLVLRGGTLSMEKPERPHLLLSTAADYIAIASNCKCKQINLHQCV